MEEQDYLIHYGVLGMKWGVRKDRNYKYTSMRTKHLTKKAAKAKAKGKKNAGEISKKLRNSKKVDKNLLEYAKKTSVGKALAQNILLGPGGAKSYQTMRANGFPREIAATSQVLSKVAGLGIGFVVGGIAGKTIGNNIVGALGLNDVPVAKQIALYNDRVQKFIRTAIDEGSLNPSRYIFTGRSKKIPFSGLVDHFPKTPNTLYDSETFKRYEKLVSQMALNLSEIDVHNLKMSNSKLAKRINDLTSNIGQKVGAAGGAYLKGTKIKLKK